MEMGAAHFQTLRTATNSINYGATIATQDRQQRTIQYHTLETTSANDTIRGPTNQSLAHSTLHSHACNVSQRRLTTRSASHILRELMKPIRSSQ